jgi:CheY-like chemotaxis protein
LSNLYDEIFRSDGYNTLIARDGQSGLDLALTKNPDFIILDMNLPKMTGLQVFEKIKLDEKAKNIPVMFLTNEADPEEQKKAMELGAKDYLSKAKYPPEDIVKRVTSLLKAA